MTAVIPARPPRADDVSSLVETSPLSASEAASLSGAMLADVAASVAASSADLLVNYPAPEDAASPDPEAALRDHLADVAPDARYEVQVGSTPAARVGNAVTHLLESEGEASVTVLRPDAPLVARADVDAAMMRLRRDDVVLGPASEGRVYLAGFTEPIDFADACAAPAVGTLAERSRDAGLDVGFLPLDVRVATGADLRTLLAVLEARRTAGRAVPERTAEAVAELGLADGTRPSVTGETERI